MPLASLTEFLQSFSEDYPFFWALLVVVMVAATGLFLYVFWEVVLGLVLSSLSRSKHGDGEGKP